MPNAIALAEKFQPILDEVYKREALTSRLDSPSKPLDHSGTNKIHIYKTSLVGLGTYDKSTGFPAGKVTGEWEEIQLTQDRGRAFSVDAMDNEETLGMAFGSLVGEFMRVYVAPEIDAYRFAQYAGATGVSKVGSGATLTASTILAAIDAASLTLDEDEVPSAGRILFISMTCYRHLTSAISRVLANESKVDRRLQTLDEMTIIPVPQSRFYTEVTLDAGDSETAGGFAKKDGTGKDLNFILMHPSAIWQATKHSPLRVFEPGVNQAADAYLFQYRVYHDAGVYDNKVDGIYVHMKA